MIRPLPLAACVLAFSTTLAVGARAQTAGEKAAAAQALFDEAMRLMKAGQTAEACPKLEESLRLDSGMATQFRLAECYEKTGKIASAWASFVAVADAAAVARLPEREVAARKRGEALVGRIPKLTITVPPTVASLEGVEVSRDGIVVAKPLWGVPVPVDPGPHAIAVKAPGKKPWQGSVTAAEGTVIAAAIPDLADAPAAAVVTAPPPPPPVTPPPPPVEHRRSLFPGLILGSVAVVAAGVGGATVALHRKNLSDAQSLSADIKLEQGTCVPGKPRFDQRCDELAGHASQADTFGNVSTVTFAVAGAAAAGAILYFVWPQSSGPAQGMRATPVVGSGFGGLSFSGSF